MVQGGSDDDQRRAWLAEGQGGEVRMHDVACARDLPPIIQERLRLDDPACLAWTEQVMAHLAVRMPPEKALWWWYRSHIALRRSPVYLLPEDWQPEGDAARFLERYAKQG